MKKEYDFSKGERGKFYRSGAKFNLTVYLDPPVKKWLDEVARRKGEEVGKLVNRLLKKERDLIKYVS